MEVRKQKVMPIGAVAMILHTCEFPDGNRWAAETAASVVNVLGDRDKVGVLLYDMGGENWGIKMQPASNKARLKSEIYNLDPGDAPDFGALMKMAHQGLTVDARDASVKHMIMISDGDPQPPSAQLMAQIRQAKITVSTVAVFPHSGGTGTLQDIARAGKGQFYNVKKPQEIPQIFLKEAQRVMKPAIIEERFVPDRLPGAQLLEGIDRVPALLGYVATSPKEAASVEVALASRREDPILVSWRYGLGKAVAFTSDAKNRWAAPWLTSSAMFSRFWAQTIRWTVRSTARADMDTQVEIQQRKGKVVVDVLDSAGDFVNLLDIRGSVAGQNVSSHLRMDQTAPGRYEGEFDAPEKGQYMVGLQYVDEKGVPRLQTVGAAVPYSPEYRNLAANTAVLSGLAERTSGRIYPTLGPQPHRDHLTRIWRRDQRAFSTPQDLWAGLLLLAVLLLPADIAVRRLMISREELVAFLGLVRDQAMTRLGLRRPERTREEGMGRLMTARRRAARQMGVDVPEEGPEPQPAPAPVSPPERSPAYSGPIRRMPTVEGAGSVTAPPAAAGSRTTPPPDLERVVEPQVSPP
ncbi:MAG: VWA domain-containing protein, partial [Armatimonadetes bacterium]|nr:VWA domain-containing protein [Armatimonadota bacterium]